MIRSFRDRYSRALWLGEHPRALRAVDADLARERLAILHAANSLADIPPLQSFDLHKLKGDRRGQWSLTIKKPWCICFTFKDGDAFDVEIIDYH